MATSEDASMPDAQVIETIDFSEGALEWLQANRQKLEDMVKRKQNMYNLEEWKKFERWAYNQSDKLDAARAQQQTMQREWQRMQVERTPMMARIARLEQGGETFSSVHQDYRTGMIAIERLVRSATKADERTLLPAGGEERIMDRLEKC